MAILTIQDMHILVSQSLQKHGVFAYRDIESEEIDLQLNYVMFEFIKDVLTDNKDDFGGFESNLRNLTALAPIYVKAATLPSNVAATITKNSTDNYAIVNATAHGLSAGTIIFINSPINTAYNGYYQVVSPTTNQFFIADARTGLVKKVYAKDATISYTLGIFRGIKTTTSVLSDYYLPVKITTLLDIPCYDSSGNATTKSKIIKCRILGNEDVENYLNNTFFHPDEDELVATISKSDIYVYTGGDVYSDPGFNISKIYLDYIQIPTKMLYNKDINGNYQSSGSVDCVLDGSVHYDIVERAALRIKKLTETDPNYIGLLEKAYKEV